ncbi:hypothetical protein ES319_A11G150200v1 [Gossypium barbadense]|uniref:NTF2 domain-containing protein n=2 Tax=Gossypium TaxID=3633 RepID=A0A5J5TSP5_GOSBA|nr:hypothetical protein ES319_A11G150200v1 [Gossypium barbadense]KAB2057159.1 hypothetical protein ES319_A11G150200v1 [Gossypium barbadense]TYG94068.1 hypothetical protein ES288_A11G159600v1 [Gossypium darwinii]
MASVEQQVPAGIATPTSDVVGNAFVHQYYLILHQSPELVHRFYHDSSKLGRPEENGGMSITTTMQAINEKILSLGYGEFTAEITTVDAQDSHNGGVLVLVTGYLTGKDKVKRKFTQSFFLAPQDKGYFVLNDVFRFVDDTKHQPGGQDPVNGFEASLTPEQGHSPVPENHIEQPAALPEECNGPEVYNPSENGDGSIEEEESPVAEVVDEIPDDSKMVSDSKPEMEELPKKSYASILKVLKENAVPVSAPTQSPVKSAVKSQEHPRIAAPPSAPMPASDAQVSSNNVTENGNNQDAEAEGPSIYVKGLPLNATPSMLEIEFKKFGPIKSGGIQVRSQKGFCFGFVEFEMASSVQSAIEASPINIGGRKAVVEEKRSTSRGNKGKSSSVSGAGYRNEGARGRGNYGGGRGYSRGEFGNRSSNRGGYSSRGGDGYQRGEHMGGNGGRVSRSGEATFNASTKNVAPRVSAPA